MGLAEYSQLGFTHVSKEPVSGVRETFCAGSPSSTFLMLVCFLSSSPV